MKKYRVIFIQHHNNLFRSNEKMKEEIVEAETFKQAREEHNQYKCGVCENLVMRKRKFCSWCGQRIDWEEK
jgi:hypothetical protein